MSCLSAQESPTCSNRASSTALQFLHYVARFLPNVPMSCLSLSTWLLGCCVRSCSSLFVDPLGASIDGNTPPMATFLSCLNYRNWRSCISGKYISVYRDPVGGVGTCRYTAPMQVSKNGGSWRVQARVNREGLWNLDCLVNAG